VKLRNDNIPVLVYGKYTLLDKNNPNVYTFTREGQGQKMLILLNFSSSIAQAKIPVITPGLKLLLSNYKEAPVIKKGTTIITLRPYQALIYELL